MKILAATALRRQHKGSLLEREQRGNPTTGTHKE